MIKTFSSFPKSYWHRVNFNDATIFFHTEQLSIKANPSHRHCDLTSFVFYWKGQPILIDPGRYNYRTDDPLGIYGISAKAHNSLVIDGLEPQAGVNTRRLPGFYRSSRVQVRNDCDAEEFIFEIKHSGFCRLFGDPIKHTRHFSLSDEYLWVEDRIYGKNVHELETYFQWSPKIKLNRIHEDSNLFNVITDNKWFKGTFRYNQIQKDDGLLQSDLIQGQGNSNIAGWCFPEYGLKEEATTLIFSEKVKLPVIRRYRLEWKV